MRFPLFLVLVALVIAAVYAAPVKDEAEKLDGEPLTEEQQDSANDETEQQNGEPLTEEEQDPMNDETEEQNGEPLTEEEQDHSMNDEAFKRFFMSRPKPKEPQRPVGPKLVPQPGETLEKDLVTAVRNGKL